MHFLKRFSTQTLFFLGIIELILSGCNLSGSIRDATIPSNYKNAEWSSDGKKVVVTGDSGLVIYPETLEKVTCSSDQAFGSISWHPQKDLIAGGDGISVIVLDGTTLIEEVRISVNDNRIIRWSPDGKLLAISSKENIEVWMFSSQLGTNLSLQKTMTLTGHLSWVKSISWSPDSRMIASTSQDGTIRIFNTLTGQEENTFTVLRNNPPGSIFSVAWNPNSDLIATAESNSSKILIWDTFTGTMMQSLESEQNGLASVKWSPDGKYLASISRHKVLVWLFDTGRVHKRFIPENGDILDATWNPDGQRIAISGAINNRPTIWIWNMISNDVLTKTQP